MEAGKERYTGAWLKRPLLRCVSLPSRFCWLMRSSFLYLSLSFVIFLFPLGLFSCLLYLFFPAMSI